MLIRFTNTYLKKREKTMTIKKIAVLGAGAVGSYIIWGLSQRDDIELGVVAEGERAERFKKNSRIALLGISNF